MSILNEHTGATLPQPLGPTDSPTFDDLTLTGDLTVDGSVIVPVVATATLSLTADSKQIIFDSDGAHPTTLSVPSGTVTRTITVPPSTIGEGAVSMLLSGGNNFPAVTEDFGFGAAVYADQGFVSDTLTITGNIVPGNSQILFETPSVGQQIVFDKDGVETIITVPIPLAGQEIILQRTGVSTAEFILSDRAAGAQTITGDLDITQTVSGDIVEATTAVHIDATSAQIVTSALSAHAVTISIPTPAQAETLTVPDVGAATASFLMSRVSGGSQSVTGSISVSTLLSASTSVLAGTGFSTAATSAQLVTASTGATPTTISVGTMAQTSTISLFDPGVAAARFVLSPAALTAGIVVSSTAGTVASSVTPSLTSVAFSSNSATPLSVYTEGTFTPGLTFGGSFTGGSLSVALGSYSRVGNRVTFDCNIIVSAVGSSTGNALITGLPYSASVSGPFTTPAVLATGVTYTATYTNTVASIGASANISLQQVSPVSLGSGSTVLNLTNVGFNVGTTIYVSGSYPTTAAA